MTRADLRAMLLLMGFAPSSTGDNNYLLKVDPLRSYGCIRVMAYPRWIIGVHTIEGTKSFFQQRKHLPISPHYWRTPR